MCKKVPLNNRSRDAKLRDSLFSNGYLVKKTIVNVLAVIEFTLYAFPLRFSDVRLGKFH